MASAFFPSGLRVLAVDDDRAFLKILEKMLKKCSYEVTTFCLARDALNTLWERKDDFDIVISDVNMPDLDGFQLLEHVRIEMDLPIIMMSIDGGVDRVMKGVQHGACGYLLKPIRMEELQNIWQHVIRKNIRKGENIQAMISGSDDDGHQQNAGETTATRKRKYMEEPESVDESITIKKATRVVWSKELHYKFVEATTQLGFDKAKPKKILDLMNVPGLRRENVASHLQKYRSYLSKLRKANEVQTFEGMKQQNFFHPPGSFGFQTSTLLHPKDAANCDPEHRDNNMLPNGVDPQSSSTHTVGLGNQVAVKDKKATPSADTSQTMLSHPFNYQTWNEIPMEHFRQPPNQDPEQYALLDDDFSHTLQSASENLIQVDPQCSAYTIGLGTSVAEKDKPNTVMITPLCLESRSGHGQTVNPEISDIYVNYLNDYEPTQPNLFAVGDSFFGSLVGCASIETRGFQTSILMHPKDAANCNPEYRDNNMLLMVDPQCSAHTGCLETQVAEKDKADSIMITPLWSQSRSDHGQTVNPVISDAISSFKVSMQNQMVNVNSLNDCKPAQQNLFAVGDSLLGSIVGCASIETIGVMDIGLFDYSDAELLAEPEETYYWNDLGFEWDLLPELLAEPEEI